MRHTNLPVGAVSGMRLLPCVQYRHGPPHRSRAKPPCICRTWPAVILPADACGDGPPDGAGGGVARGPLPPAVRVHLPVHAAARQVSQRLQRIRHTGLVRSVASHGWSDWRLQDSKRSESRVSNPQFLDAGRRRCCRSPPTARPCARPATRHAASRWPATCAWCAPCTCTIVLRCIMRSGLAP